MYNVLNIQGGLNMNENKIKVTISLSKDILTSIDQNARVQGLSRSAYITKLYLDDKNRQLQYMSKYRNEI